MGLVKGQPIRLSTKNPWLNLLTQTMSFPLQHPKFIIRDSIADQFTQNSVFNANLKFRLGRKIKKVFKNYQFQ